MSARRRLSVTHANPYKALMARVRSIKAGSFGGSESNFERLKDLKEDNGEDLMSIMSQLQHNVLSESIPQQVVRSVAESDF